MQSITHQVESLLIQAEQAHGQYEQTVLKEARIKIGQSATRIV